METAQVTSSYVHVQRSLDLIGRSYGGLMVPPDESIQKGFFFHRITDAVVQWLIAAQTPTLGALLAKDEVAVGTIFCHTGLFFCRGMSAYLQGKRKALPDVYAKLEDFSPGLTLIATANPDHLTSVSASDHLAGQRRLFFAGVISGVSNREIEARPIIIGMVVQGSCSDAVDLGFPAAYSNGELYVSQIDAFSALADVSPPSLEKVGRLKEVPEESVKNAFAEIIGEPFVPKDWGGEMSDLVSTNVSVDGRRMSSAFAFKGPAKFHPLTVADMGKNGDQIFRLFNEPAELVVVQHCHQITSPVRAHMRAFAQWPGRARMFCLINGSDTVKILSAYGKLGFGHQAS
ncbi:MAG: hypothetical protein WB973_04520 [Thermoanaerobaculia bacterium]